MYSGVNFYNNFAECKSCILQCPFIVYCAYILVKKDNRIQNKQSNKEPSSDNSGNWITIGLSLGIVIGFLIDDIGLGMCLGVMMGVSIGPAIDVLRKNKKSEEQEDNDEKE